MLHIIIIINYEVAVDVYVPSTLGVQVQLVSGHGHVHDMFNKQAKSVILVASIRICIPPIETIWQGVPIHH